MKTWDGIIKEQEAAHGPEIHKLISDVSQSMDDELEFTGLILDDMIIFDIKETHTIYYNKSSELYFIDLPPAGLDPFDDYEQVFICIGSRYSPAKIADIIKGLRVAHA